MNELTALLVLRDSECSYAWDRSLLEGYNFLALYLGEIRWEEEFEGSNGIDYLHMVRVFL